MLGVEQVPVTRLEVQHNADRQVLTALRNASERIAQCGDLAALFDAALQSIDECFGISHSMLLMLDETGQALYAVASRGYAESGVGAEIPLGQGVIGVCAQHRTPIRIAYMTSEYAYGRALRASALKAGMQDLQAEIAFAGLERPQSQMAVPLLANGSLHGVLYVESIEKRRFGYDEEDALVSLGAQLAIAICAARHSGEAAEARPLEAKRPTATTGTTPACIRHYCENNVVFIDDAYLIKGVAGAIFWKLMSEYAELGRVEFSNRELRLARGLGLPELDDNLETRLILLARRLAERCDFIAIEKTGRGRFRLRVDRPVTLDTVKAPS